jgi:hypothetical protein
MSGHNAAEYALTHRLLDNSFPPKGKLNSTNSRCFSVRLYINGPPMVQGFLAEFSNLFAFLTHKQAYFAYYYSWLFFFQ